MEECVCVWWAVCVGVCGCGCDLGVYNVMTYASRECSPPRSNGYIETDMHDICSGYTDTQTYTNMLGRVAKDEKWFISSLYSNIILYAICFSPFLLFSFPLISHFTILIFIFKQISFILSFQMNHN